MKFVSIVPINTVLYRSMVSLILPSSSSAAAGLISLSDSRLPRLISDDDDDDED